MKDTNKANTEKKAILTYNAPFLNSDAIFIEYDDVIKCPFFIFLMSIAENEALNMIFDLSDLEGLDIDALYEWYINRKNQNIFKSLPLRKGVIKEFFGNDFDNFDSWCESVIYNSIENNEYFVDMDTEMNFASSLDLLMKSKIVMKYFIYTPIKSEMIQKDLVKKYGDKFKYVYGDLETVLKENNITANSTFVFSDLTKIKVLEKIGILNYASILIADRYGYNYKDEENLILDVESLSKSSIFKLDFFDNLNTFE